MRRPTSKETCRRPVAALALLAAVACERPGAPERRPNVLLVSIDSLRADHLGCYGYERDTTPRIDALAAEGVRFETVVSSTSWTLAAHAALFTSLPDSVHGAFRPQDRLAEDRVTLAERLSAAGYRTAGLYSGPFLHPAFGLAQGFDEWISCTASDAADGSDASEPGGAEGTDEADADDSGVSGAPGAGASRDAEARVRKGRERDARALVAHEDVTSPKLLAAFERWLDARADDAPFLLFVHMWDPHYHYLPPPPYDRRWDADYDGPQDGRGLWEMPAIRTPLAPRDLAHVVALYDGEIAFTDEHVGRMVDALRARGLLDDTLVVVTADHGEEFFEHGAFGHHRTLMDESVLVPLVMRYPARIPAGRRVAAQVRLHDVAPTILELAGAPPFELAYGASLVDLLDGAGAGADRPAFGELHVDGQEALRRPPLKALHVAAEQRETTYVFDLERDARELRPLAATDPRVAGATGALAEASRHAAALRALVGARETAEDVPAEVLEELRGLGYLGD